MKRGSKEHQRQPSMRILLYSVSMAAATTTESVYVIGSYKREYEFKKGPMIIFDFREYSGTLITATFVFMSCSNRRNMISFKSNTDYVDRCLLSIGATESIKIFIILFKIHILFILAFILMPLLFISFDWIMNNMPMLDIVAVFLLYSYFRILLHSWCICNF
jgi:hypothetical protein